MHIKVNSALLERVPYDNDLLNKISDLLSKYCLDDAEVVNLIKDLVKPESDDMKE
jgi:hypothetical protein